MKKPLLTITAAVLALSVNERADAAALALDGVGDWASFVGTGVPTGADPFTIGVWINPTTIPTGGGNGGQITFWGNQAGNQANGFRLRGEGGTRHFFWGNDHDENFPGGSILADNTNPGHTGGVGGSANNGWHHLAIVWDGAQTVQYFNGAPLGNPRAAAGVNVADANYRIGSRLDAEYFHGFIDELSIWNVPLDAATIAGGWNLPIDHTNPAVAPFLAAYWDFEGGVGDLTGGGNDLTLQGDSFVDAGADAFNIPEPAAATLGALGLLLLFRRRR